MLRQVFAFGLVGVGNGVVTYLLIVLMLRHSQWPEAGINFIAYLAGLAHGYAWNRRWTFRFRGHWLGSGLRYALSFAIAYVANLALVLALRAAEVNPYLAHAAGMPVYTVIFFLLAKYYVFADGKALDSNRNSV